MDIAKRNPSNPLLRPSDLHPCIEGMEITCLLNPGVFRLGGKTWLLLRVAERPVQKEGVISFPVYNDKGEKEDEDVVMKNENQKKFIDEIRCRNGNLGVILSVPQEKNNL